MNRYAVRERGYELRNALLGAKGTSEDACIRGTIYQLLNALSVGNVESFYGSDHACLLLYKTSGAGCLH